MLHDSGERAPAESQPVAASHLRMIVMVLLALLTVQFLLGIYANLYVAFPTQGTTMMDGMNTVMSHVGLASHMVLGLVLAAVGCAAAVIAVRTGVAAVAWIAVAGLAALVGAGIAGMVFVMAGQANAASYVMAVGFLASFASYFAELVVVPRQPAVPRGGTTA